MRNFFIGILLSITVVSCTTISVHQTTQKLTETNVELGSIGLSNETVISNSYKSIAIPVFEEKIKLSVQPVAFSKQTFKAFAKANEQTKKVALAYTDSLNVKPEYVLLQFVDRVAITSALNDAKNTGLRSYLETKEDAQMVTSVAVGFSTEDINLLKKAEEVFLVQSASKKFSLQLVFLDGKKQVLVVSKGVVFAYETANFCWKENNKHKLVIADIVSDSEGCPPNTHRKAHKAVQKDNYFKL
ncbi:hypothetical protein KORDIASMS9_01430 [Kordia sp. SMS9]|uniref:hypothetical protein n=1 Tax=Kordia sp. SMS9 TaxID=2282170 RepID=UPI000E0DBF08|nr:hypothetical protein [Kordia sp. SMS9]AXG69210.1 hypothetical protein KORDIASMS9_01430 [Kordia sp. SMS9]